MRLLAVAGGASWCALARATHLCPCNSTCVRASTCVRVLCVCVRERVCACVRVCTCGYDVCRGSTYTQPLRPRQPRSRPPRPSRRPTPTPTRTARRCCTSSPPLRSGEGCACSAGCRPLPRPRLHAGRACGADDLAGDGSRHPTLCVCAAAGGIVSLVSVCVCVCVCLSVCLSGWLAGWLAGWLSVRTEQNGSPAKKMLVMLKGLPCKLNARGKLN